MGGWPAFGQDHPVEFFPVIFQQFRRAHILGHHDGIIGKVQSRRRFGLAHQMTDQPVGQIIHITEPFPEVRIFGL